MNTVLLRASLAACGLLCVLAPFSIASAAKPKAPAAPASISAHYDVFKDGTPVGAAEQTYESDGSHYRLTSVTTPVGVGALFAQGRITESSEGDVTPQGLKPARMSYQRSDKPAKNMAAEFDWAAGVLHLHYDGRDEDAPLEAGAQDRLSVMYQFVFLTAAGVKELSFPMTNGRKVQRYEYRLQDMPQVETPLGRYSTLHLVKQTADGGNGTEVWLARAHRLFPVRLVIIDNGSRLEQVLTALDMR